jgi:hypothetical protein
MIRVKISKKRIAVVWADESKYLWIYNNRECLKHAGIGPRLKIYTNGATPWSGDMSYHLTIIIGYIELRYANYDLWR